MYGFATSDMKRDIFKKMTTSSDIYNFFLCNENTAVAHPQSSYLFPMKCRSVVKQYKLL